jgi:hypothetical protein
MNTELKTTWEGVVIASKGIFSGGTEEINENLGQNNQSVSQHMNSEAFGCEA